MNPFGFLSNLFGGATHAVGQAVNNIAQGHPFSNQPAPQPQRPAPPPPRPNPQINLAAFAHVLNQQPQINLPNIKSPAQLRAAATLKALGGPPNPNYVSHQPNLGDIAGQALGGIAGDVKNSVTGIPVHLGLQLADMANGATGHYDPNTPATYQASNPVTRAIFGNAPIKSYQGQAQDASQQLKGMGVNSTLANAASIPIAGLLAGMDLSQFKIAKEALPATKSGIDAASKGAQTVIDNQAAHAAQVAQDTQKLIDQGVPAGHARMVAQGGQGGYIGQPRDLLGKFGVGKQGADPIVNPKTGETLSQAVQKLQNNGWGEAEINKFKQAVLKPTAKPVNDPNVLNSLNPTGGLFVDYAPKTRATMPMGKDMTTLDKTSGKAPNDMVTIYRGAPKNQKGINPGDFITTNRDLAKSYGDNVIEKNVPASHVLDSKSSPLGEEYLYRPTSTPSLLSKAKQAYKNSPLNSERGSINLGATIGKDKPPIAPKSGVPLKTETPIIGPKLKVRGLTKGIKGSDNFSPVLQKAVSSQYAPFTDKAAIAAHEKFARQPLEVQNTQAITHLSGDGTVGKQEVVNFGKTIQALDAAGKTDQATAIHDLLAKKLTESGQTSQAASLLYNRTPEGMQNIAMKTLRNAKVEITPELQSKIQIAIEKIKATAEGSPERGYAGQELIHLVQSHIPSGKVDQAIGIWKAGLLTGIKTQTGNAVSNIASQGLKKVSDVPATAIDKAFSVFTGQRTKTFTMKGLAFGTKEGTIAAGKYLKTGIDERNLANIKYDTKQLNYKNPVLNTYVNGVFKLMGAADRPYYYAALRNSMADIAKADGINKGFKGKELSNYVTDFVKNPSDQAQQVAVNAAEKSIFANDTLLSNMAAGLRSKVSDHPVGNAAVNVIMPFTKVPSSVVTQVFDYTPVGAVKEIVSQAYKGKLDQRTMVEALGKTTVGSVGVISTGVALANAGILSGSYPKDPKEQAAWKAEGKQPNSILIAGKWRSLNYVSPLGPLLGMGQNIAQASKDGANALDQVSAAVTGGVQTALGQSFLQGVQGVLDAVNDPTRYAAKTAKSMIASVIPTLVGNVASATDSIQRQSNSTLDALKAKIPGARQTLLPSQDAFGNTLARPTSGTGTMIDPLRSTTDLSNPLTKELDRLQSVKQGVYPTPDKTLQVGTQQIKLTPEQATAYNNAVGQQTQASWNQITNTPEYKALSDDKKKAALQSAMDDIRNLQKKTALQQMGNMAAADKVKLTTQQIQLAEGHTTPTTYTTKVALAGAASDPATRYQTHLTAFNEAVKAGTLSGAKALSTQQSLQREAITSKYSQDVLDFYALSNTQKQAYFKQDPTTAKTLYDQSKQLDSQLVSNGSTSKYTKTGGIKIAKAKVAKAPKAPKIALKQIHLSKAPTIKMAKAGKAKKFKIASAKPGKALKLLA